METKHTPGPWTANLAPQGGFDIEKDPNELGRYMVLATRNANEARAEEMHANARLIAAAPDLLDALIDALSASGGDHPIERFMAWQAKARKAVAKATGQ